MIRNLIPYELGGTVDLAYTTSGVRSKIEIPSEQATGITTSGPSTGVLSAFAWGASSWRTTSTKPTPCQRPRLNNEWTSAIE